MASQVIALDILMHQGTVANGITYPRLEFDPHCFFAVGSPIPCFLVARQQVRPVTSAGAQNHQFSMCSHVCPCTGACAGVAAV